MTHPNPAVRKRTLNRVLEKHGDDPKVIELLVAIMNDKNHPGRGAVFYFVEWQAEEGRFTLPAEMFAPVLAGVDDDSFQLRRAAISLAGYYADRTEVAQLAPLLAKIATQGDDQAFAAQHTLGKLGRAEILFDLYDNNQDVDFIRAEIAAAMGWLSEPNEKVVEILMKECSSEDHRNSDRNDLLVALGRARPTTDAAIDLLKKFTKDEGLFIRRGAVTGLGEVDPSFKDKIIPTLEAIANDPSSDEQLLASDILELLGGG